jgi:hypothetical protein
VFCHLWPGEAGDEAASAILLESVSPKK